MGVKMTPSVNEIQAYLEKEMRKHIHRVIASLQYVGEQVVNGIRDGSMSNWNDQTGNLRSSIGYIVCVNGEPVNVSGFEQLVGPNANVETRRLGEKTPPLPASLNGGEMGEKYALRIASLYPRGITLIVVAGMEYASYVEAMDNKTVLAQGEIEARSLIKEMINRLNSRNSND